MDSLFEAFYLDRVEPAELEQLLLEEFKGAQALSSSEVVYPSEGHRYAVKLQYRDGVISDVAAGPALTEEQIRRLEDRIRRELLGEAQVRIGRAFVFSGVPVNGYFRYEDCFQIGPVPSDAPRPDAAIGEHPSILEFAFRTTASMPIRYARRALRARELELLLNAVLNTRLKT